MLNPETESIAQFGDGSLHGTKATVELKDMGKFFTVKEVNAAIDIVLEGSIEVKLFVSKVHSWGQEIATVTLTAEKTRGLTRQRVF